MEPFRFLDLPPEIRDQVYPYLVTASRNKLPPPSADDPASYHLQLGILGACKLTHTEGLRVFQRTNTLCVFSTPWPEAEAHVSREGRVPLLATDESGGTAQLERYAALVVHADAPVHPTTTKSSFVMCVDDLPAFTTMWYYMDLTNLELNVHLRIDMRLGCNAVGDALPAALQERLLLPWGQVRRLQDVKVMGLVDRRVEKEMRARMAQPYPEPEASLEKAAADKEVGDAALKVGECDVALEAYRRAFLALHIVVDGRRRDIWGDEYFQRVMRSGRYRNQHGNMVRMVLRIQLVSETVQAFNKKRDFGEARFWGMRSINLIRGAMGLQADDPSISFPGAGDWGRLCYRTGVACRELKQRAEAWDLLQTAIKWLPDDPNVQLELAEVTPSLGS